MTKDLALRVSLEFEIICPLAIESEWGWYLTIGLLNWSPASPTAPSITLEPKGKYALMPLHGPLTGSTLEFRK